MTRLRAAEDELSLNGHPYPWVFLSAHGLDVEAMEHVERAFGVVRKREAAVKAHHFFVTGRDATHREKAITLVGFAMAVLRRCPGASIILGDIPILALQIKGQSDFSLVEDEVLAAIDWPRAPGMITFSYAVGVWLNGFVLRQAPQADWETLAASKVECGWRELVAEAAPRRARVA